VNEAALAAINAPENRYDATDNNNWQATDAEYAAMRAGVDLLDQQLSLASHGDYRIAESLMARYLLWFYSDDEKAADATPKQ
jgi:hypothetical protein